MNGVIKTAALAALLASTAAFAQANEPTTTGDQGADFSTLDADRDGSVSQAEAKADATLSSKFAELDTNKDGKLSSSEYGKMQGKEGKKEY